jgi:hypothetical protein
VLGSLIFGVLAWVPFAALVWHYRRGLTGVPDDDYEREPPMHLSPAVVGTLFGARRFAVDSAATQLKGYTTNNFSYYQTKEALGIQTNWDEFLAAFCQ